MTHSSCEQVQEWMIQVLDGGPADSPAELQAHLDACPACQAYGHSMKTLIGSLRDMDDVPPPPDLTDRVLSRIQPTVVPKAPSEGGRWRRWMPVAAAALLLAVAVPWLLQRSSQPEGTPQLATTTSHPPVTGTLSSDPPKMTVQPDQPAHTQSLTPATGTTGTPKPPVTVHMHPSASGHQVHDPLETPNGTSNETPEPAITPEESELALAMSTPPTDAFDGTGEDDIYYDPLATLVGF